MAASSYRQKDLERAIRLYSAALDLADEQTDERLAGAALSNLASLYVKSGRTQIPQDLLGAAVGLSLMPYGAYKTERLLIMRRYTKPVMCSRGACLVCPLSFTL